MCGGLGEFSAPVPCLHHEQPGEPVEDPAASLVIQMDALGAGDHRDRSLSPLIETGEVHPQVVSRGGGISRCAVGADVHEAHRAP